MSDIKTGLMFNPLTKRIYWGKVNIKTSVSIGNNQKDITSDFIGTMLQKFPINTRQNVTSNGKTECVVIVLDEEKAKEYINAKEENAQLKADKAELVELLLSIPSDIADSFEWFESNDQHIDELIQKHKEPINGN